MQLRDSYSCKPEQELHNLPCNQRYGLDGMAWPGLNKTWGSTGEEWSRWFRRQCLYELFIGNQWSQKCGPYENLYDCFLGETSIYMYSLYIRRWDGTFVLNLKLLTILYCNVKLQMDLHGYMVSFAANFVIMTKILYSIWQCIYGIHAAMWLLDNIVIHLANTVFLVWTPYNTVTHVAVHRAGVVISLTSINGLLNSLAAAMILFA